MDARSAKPIVGILTSRTDLLRDFLGMLSDFFGREDIVGDWLAFDHTRYYEEEMGSGLLRTFVSFERHTAGEDAAQFKKWTRIVEDDFRRGGKRTVNLDAGTLDANKVVLVSGKHGGHKIALAPGVWADIMLWYNRGWVALPWAFPDFRDGKLFPLFTEMRKRYKDAVNSEPPPTSPS
ncbi:MAG TPA: DUF4416 family protein [Synergistales bacterium]|nr:DUF4416 family protein [Synergistales bacterium]